MMTTQFNKTTKASQPLIKSNDLQIIFFLLAMVESINRGIAAVGGGQLSIFLMRSKASLFWSGRAPPNIMYLWNTYTQSLTCTTHHLYISREEVLPRLMKKNNLQSFKRHKRVFHLPHTKIQNGDNHTLHVDCLQSSSVLNNNCLFSTRHYVCYRSTQG